MGGGRKEADEGGQGEERRTGACGNICCKAPAGCERVAEDGLMQQILRSCSCSRAGRVLSSPPKEPVVDGRGSVGAVGRAISFSRDGRLVGTSFQSHAMAKERPESPPPGRRACHPCPNRLPCLRPNQKPIALPKPFLGALPPVDSR